ncbi:MAG: hypothetical protein ABSH05_09350 [Bryobacteraceae bacterium]|jgi:hypothetical protein
MKAALLFVLLVLLVLVAASRYRLVSSRGGQDAAALFRVIEALIRQRPFTVGAVSRITQTTLRALDSNQYFATFVSDRAAGAPVREVELRIPTSASSKKDGLAILSVDAAARITPEAVTKHFGSRPDFSVPEPAAPYEFAYRYKQAWGDLSFEFARGTRYLIAVAIDAIESQPAASTESAPATEQGTAPSPPREGGEWLDVFAAYPGARELCSQHVSGNLMHILWHAYVTRDIPEKVIAFYVQAEGQEHLEREENSVRLRHGDKVLSIHSASAKDYPDCGKAPGPEEKTVIIVSQAIRPSK